MSDALFLEALAPGGASDTTVPSAELPRQGRLVVGSSADRASFLVSGQGVADVHCTIGRLKSGGWALKDLGSDFGTMLNGKKVDAAKLKDGDEIVIGSRKLRVFSTASEAASPKGASGAGDKTKAAPKAAAAAPKKSAAKKQPAPKAPKAPAKAPRTRELGGYRLEKPLGRGAMGDVYLAVQTSLDRRVALKVLKSELAKDATFVQRFRGEAKAAARLNHPNIVTVFDVGEEGGQHYLSMEYMDASSLEQQLQSSGPIPWREALEILRDAAAGLVYAETSGIVHRDIKPENLMRNKDGVTKIADLGLAIQVEQEGVDSEVGKVFGTPHFLAPEVVRGAPATASSDLYSLGATAYRVLCGHTPFEGNSAREILRSALQDDAPPLVERVPGLPAAMADTVHRLLAKSPEDRHPSAAILLAEIDRLRQSGGQVGGAAVPDAKSAGLPKPLIIGGGALLAVGVAAMLALGGGDGEEPTQPDRFPTRDGSTGQNTLDSTDSSQTANADGSADPSTSVGDLSTDPTLPDQGNAGTTGGAEQSFEFRAKAAYDALGDEALLPGDRATRLRALAQSFAGTDMATQAVLEADTIESETASAVASEASANAARTTAIAALRSAAALETVPFVAATSIKAVQAVVLEPGLGVDMGVRRARNKLIDEVMQLGIAQGKAALAAADDATHQGSFKGTKLALESFVAISSLPTVEDAPILSDDTLPPSVAEFLALGESVSTRLSLLAGSEAEFEASRLRKERALVSTMLGGGLESQLANFEMATAAKTLDAAANMTTEEPLRSLLMERAGDLQAADAALQGLVSGWDAPGWRRRSVIDPRPGASGSVEIVGVETNRLSVIDGGETTNLDFATWAGHTAELENLFLGRLKRDWTAEESHGIATLLALSATLETLRSLEPALGATAMRVDPADTGAITAPFEKAVEWAASAQDDLADELPAVLDERTLPGIVAEQRRAATMLADALIARDQGRWAASAERLERLLAERRDAWLVMILARGAQ